MRYSIAGRVRDEHGMKNDYRNYLFESYIKVLERYKPKTFADDYIFEGSNMELYKMIGNAVPSLAAKCCANAVYDILTENGN